MQKTIALISAFPPSSKSLNEYGYHLALNFAKDARIGKVIVLADILDEELSEWDLGDKIEVQRVWRFNAVSNPISLLRALREVKPDLALFNLQTASFGDREVPAALGLMAPMLARYRGYQSGVIAHNMVSGVDMEDTVLKGKPIRQNIVKLGAAVIDRSLLKSNYITFTLPSYAEHYSKAFPKANVHHVPHGIFDTDRRDLVPYESRPKRMVTMGKFGTYKRLETLIKAMEILRQSPDHQDLELVIGGTDHPNTAGYMKTIEALCVDKPYIQFHGYVAEEDVPAFFEQSRISVFDYSSTTGSSGVLHQTASYGSVPVFPAIGDFVDIAEDEGIVGENYEPNNAESMAAAIQTLLHDPKRAEKIGESNRKAAEGMPFSTVTDFHIKQIS